MQGISSKAANGVENKKKYNGIEQTTELDLNQYDAFYRPLDPQIGRWWQVDPKCEPKGVDENSDEEDGLQSLEGLTPYNAMGNNPVKYNDPKGDIFGLDNLIGAVVGAAIDYGFQVAENLSSGKSFRQSLTQIDGKRILTSAAIGFVTDGVANIAGKAISKTGSALVTKLEPAVAKLAQSNIVKQTGNVAKNILSKSEGLPHAKLIKNIVKSATKPGNALSDAKIDQLKRVVTKLGGDVRTEVGETGTVNGIKHSHVEGFGQKTASRHIIHANQN